MKIEDIVRLPDEKLRVKAVLREVIRDVNEKPQVFVRVRLTGWHFPQRALEPFVVIGDVASNFVVIGPDGLTADAYFEKTPPAAKRVSFGYGNIISWDFPVSISPKRIETLDRAKLHRGVVDLRN